MAPVSRLTGGTRSPPRSRGAGVVLNELRVLADQRSESLFADWARGRQPELISGLQIASSPPGIDTTRRPPGPAMFQAS